MVLGLLIAAALQTSTLSFDYRSGEGLTVQWHGVPIIRGSGFQYYEPGWSKGLYSSTYNAQEVDRSNPNDLKMTFRSPEGRATGVARFWREGATLNVEYEFHWTGGEPVDIELTGAYLWAPAVQAGGVQVDQGQVQNLAIRNFRSRTDMGERRFGNGAARCSFTAPIGNFSLIGKPQFTLFDARGFAQDYAEGKDLLWYGILGTRVGSDQAVKVGFTIEFDEKSVPVPGKLALGTLSRTLKGALAPGGATLPLIPKPMRSQLDWSKPVVFDSFGALSVRSDKGGHREILQSWADRTGIKLSTGSQPLALSLIGPIEPTVDGGFRISIAKNRAIIEGDGLPGSRQGLRCLLNLIQVRNGLLALPTCEIVSHPATQWRGVHLFVGPNALDFHKKLWTRVLLPMGFNKVVLQCERTEWECLPNLRGGINMKRSDLAKLCDWYRSVGVEPIPLVQSFGHAEWLFAKGANLDLAFNRIVPYAIDPRKDGVKPLFERLWKEVIEVTKARTIHFGLDEVDMLGFPENPRLVTDLWKIQLPILSQIAISNGVEMMLWGDKGLAPGEAADATLGDDKENAAARRRSIPVGSYIADWHYKADPNPATFMGSLLLWEREGFQPIAASWFRPENVRGFNLAAVAHGFGTLQTTWAGYESSEANMLREAKQFSAMVLAGDYSWSGREDPLDKLGYEPMQVFQKLYFGRPWSMRGEGGESVVFGKTIGIRQLGALKFLLCEPVGFGSLVLNRENLVEEISLESNFLARELDLAIDGLVKVDDGTLVAEVEVETSGGLKRIPLVYGWDVRATGDPSALVRAERDQGLSVVRVVLGATDVRVSKRRILRKDPVMGLRLHGITAL
ncbi:MAG: hypothetical protein IT203_09010 [Fimbriimonadaceae bacterium]|nr:hypothetical protein [Fimbriimonadaceae bacterium]